MKITGPLVEFSKGTTPKSTCSCWTTSKMASVMIPASQYCCFHCSGTLVSRAIGNQWLWGGEIHTVDIHRGLEVILDLVWESLQCCLGVPKVVRVLGNLIWQRHD